MPLSRSAKALLVLSWVALPIAIVAGLWHYGHAVPQSVPWTTYNVVATYSFWACALAGLIAIFLPKQLNVPRFLVGFLALLMFIIGSFAFPATCYPPYLGDKVATPAPDNQGSAAGSSQKCS